MPKRPNQYKKGERHALTWKDHPAWFNVTGMFSPRSSAIHAMCLKSPGELRYRRRGSPPIYGDVRAGSRRDLQVTPQHWGAGARINFLEAHCFTVAMTKDRLPSGCPHVGHPIRVFTEHGYEIAFALVVR